jgi:hypothetical protein
MGFTDLGLSMLQMNFSSRPTPETSDEAIARDSAPASKAIEYDLIWETKLERERMNGFLKELSEQGDCETVASGDLLMAKIKRDSPTLYAELVAAVPGLTDLDLETPDLETVRAA